MDSWIGAANEWNWVGDHKWLYSEQEGRDIGTPATVDRMIRIIHGLKPQDRIPLIEGYLLGPDKPDYDGLNQLEGELKRFVAQREMIQPIEVDLCKEHVVQYGNQYNLNKAIIQKLVERLGL